MTSIIAAGMWSPSILLRISRPMSGEVDGVKLSRFHAGQIYPFSPTLAAFVVAIRAGVPVEGEGPAPTRRDPSAHIFRAPEPRAATYWNGRERRQDRR